MARIAGRNCVVGIFIAFFMCASISANDPDSRRIIASLTQSDGFGVMYSPGPRIILYADGTVIFAKHENDEAVYYRGSFDKTQFEALEQLIRPPNPFYELKSRIRLAPAHDLPHMTVTLYYGETPKSVNVYGYTYKNGRGVSAAPHSDSRNIPMAFHSVVRVLLETTPDKSERWHPDHIELRVANDEEPDQTRNRWPSGWPKPTEPPSLKVKEDDYSIIVSASEFGRVKQFFEDSPFFDINGQWYCLYWWSPLFPGSARWHEFSGEESGTVEETKKTGTGPVVDDAGSIQ